MTTAPIAHHPDGPPNDPASAAITEELSRPMAKVRVGARRLLVAREAAWIVACFCAALVAMGLIDYVLRMPWGVRLGFWLVGIALLVIDTRKRLLPALRFNPPLREVALRVERTRDAASAGLRGVLTAGLELSASPDRAADAGQRERVISAARTRLKLLSPAHATLVPGPTRRVLLLAALALAPLAGLMAWQPVLTTIGLRRVLTPWTVAAWPKRTTVADATAITAHPIGAAMPLRAIISRTDRAAGRTDVWAMYRLVDDGRESPVRRALLTGQGRNASVPGESDSRGELYERLIEPTGLAPANDPSVPGAPASLTVEYWFETDDDKTAPTRVVLVEPPAVVGATAEFTPPPYATLAGDFLSGTRDLGNGRDERASASPVLAGSQISIRLALNKPVSPPSHLGAAFPGAVLPTDAAVRAEGSAWTLTWTAREPLRLPVMLVDEYGIRADRDAAFQFSIVADRAPAAAVVDPASDESVLATALLNIAGEGRDDVGLAWTSLDMQVARPPAQSVGAPPEASDAPAVLARIDGAGGATKSGSAARQIRVTADVDLSTMALKPRDEVWLTALAKDTFAADSAAHEPVRSTVRRLRIIAETELVEQVRSELAGVRQAALRLDQDQGDIARRAETAAPADLRPLQDGLTQRIAPQGEVMKRLADRVARNNLVDRSLTGLLQDSAAAIQQAEKSSNEASHDLEQADRAAEDAAARERLTKEATDRQRQVRDQLGRLISMLDRGQDGYTVRREVQRLIEEQRRLMEQTRELGQQTRGQKPSDLPQNQHDALAQASDQQQDLARRAAQMLTDMAQRSVDLQRQDPALAQAMQKSAERGKQDQVADKQRQAAEQLRQNQTGSANQSQEQAIQSLQQMMEELDQTEKQRDEALKRILEDAIQSIQALVETQQNELASLGRALPSAAFKGLDAGMIRLNADTIGVADKIRSSFREMAGVADLLDGAARAQSTAVTILRADSPDGAEADQAERTSLERLRAAKEEAERLRREADDKDQAKKREDLRRAYQESLEAQVALHAKTAPLLGQELDRRQRAGVRGLSDQQVQIRTNLTTLRDKNPGIGDAKLFEFAHKRLDDSTGRAATVLAEGAVTAAVDRDQLSAIRVLQSLVEALKNPKSKDFRDSPEDSSGDGAGGGQKGKDQLIAPLAELRLLRLMQQEVADLTRAADEDRGTGKADAGALEDLGRMQSELTHRAEEMLDQERPADEPAPKNTSGANFGAPPADGPPQDSVPPAPPVSPRPADAEPPKGDPSNPLPSLDDLLGLPKSGTPTPGDGTTVPTADAAREELERQLSPEQASGAQAELLTLLRQASQRLGPQRDPGVATQRAQAEAIKRLDQLIDMQERNQRQSQSRSSQKQQKQQPEPKPSPQKSQTQKPEASSGDNRQAVDPPARQDGTLKAPAPGAGARWGTLPEHIRDALTQGKSDRYSAIYRSLTEEYYRRLAEEPRPAGSPR